MIYLSAHTRHLIKVWSVIMLAFCSGANLFSQCIPAPALACEDAPVFCALSELNGYRCSNPQNANPSGPSPLCPEGGIPNNISWWAFVSGGGRVEIRITTLNCSTPLNPGIQAGIYSNCDFVTPIACLAECFTGSEILSGITDPCQTYYVFVDGCNGASCEYTIEVLLGADPPSVLDEPTLDVDNVACPGEEICANAMIADRCASDFIWTINGVLSEITGPTYCDRFSKPGINQICVQAILGNQDNICQLSPQICQEILVEDIPVENLPDEIFCFEDRSGIFFRQCATPVPNIPGLYSICCKVIGQGGCIQELCKSFEVRPPIEPGNSDWLYCENGKVVLPDGNVVEECGQYEIRLPGGSRNGCDSSYVINLIYLVPEVSFEAPTCESDSYCLSAKATFPCLNEAPGYNQFWTSGDGKDTLVKGTERLCTDIPGEYCYHFDLSLNGIPCVKQSTCIQVPISPQMYWRGRDTVCSDVQYWDTIRIRSTQVPDRYEWSVENGWIVGPDTDSIIVWQTDRTDGSVELCCKAFFKNCLLSDTCVSRAILDSPDPGIEWKQEGNFLILRSTDTIGTFSSWKINGSSYFGKEVQIRRYSNELINVEHQIRNQCDSSATTQWIPFFLSRSFDMKKPYEIEGAPQIPLKGEDYFDIKTGVSDELTYRVIDLSGKIIRTGTVLEDQSFKLANLLSAELPSGLYYLAIYNPTGLVRTIRIPGLFH